MVLMTGWGSGLTGKPYAKTGLFDLNIEGFGVNYWLRDRRSSRVWGDPKITQLFEEGNTIYIWGTGEEGKRDVLVDILTPGR